MSALTPSTTPESFYDLALLVRIKKLGLSKPKIDPNLDVIPFDYISKSSFLVKFKLS